MEAKVIRSGEKNFEEEKAKMFDPKVLTKEEQLKVSFKMLLTTMLEAVKEEYYVGDLIDSYTNLLLKEVKIRVDLK